MAELSLQTKLWIVVAIVGVFALVSSHFLNWIVSRKRDELSSWNGWLLASMFRMVCLCATGAGFLVMRGKMTDLEVNYEPQLLALTAVLVGGMIIDAVLSTRRLRNIDEN